MINNAFANIKTFANEEPAVEFTASDEASLNAELEMLVDGAKEMALLFDLENVVSTEGHSAASDLAYSTLGFEADKENAFKRAWEAVKAFFARVWAKMKQFWNWLFGKGSPARAVEEKVEEYNDVVKKVEKAAPTEKLQDIKVEIDSSVAEFKEKHPDVTVRPVATVSREPTTPNRGSAAKTTVAVDNIEAAKVNPRVDLGKWDVFNGLRVGMVGVISELTARLNMVKTSSTEEFIATLKEGLNDYRENVAKGGDFTSTAEGRRIKAVFTYGNMDTSFGFEVKLTDERAAEDIRMPRMPVSGENVAGVKEIERVCEDLKAAYDKVQAKFNALYKRKDASTFTEDDKRVMSLMINLGGAVKKAADCYKAFGDLAAGAVKVEIN